MLQECPAGATTATRNGSLAAMAGSAFPAFIRPIPSWNDSRAAGIRLARGPERSGRA